MATKIELTGVDLVKLAQAAYTLSVPQGLGFLQPHEKELTEQDLVNQLFNDHPNLALSMDYVNGRACKLTVHREGEKLFMYAPWYDHTDKQLAELLQAVGVAVPSEEQEHGVAYNCAKCQASRR